jgi:phosphatidylglycerol:prolipoprotein diacylglycerol transferase
MIGGRLGDVIFYNWDFYSQNLLDILKIRNGGMSFVGGFIGVAIAIAYIKKKFKLVADEMRYLFDFIVLFLPLGILFGRIGNSLNQELYGKVVDLSAKIGSISFESLYKWKIIRIFESVDSQFRRNTNLLEGFWEGAFLFIVQALLFWKKLWTGKIWRPGFVSGVFCIMYGLIRIVLETLRDNPPAEYRN